MPVVELSYMGYSPPKCTCNGNQTHSRKYLILLECLHDMDENATHPFPLLEPSLTPSRMPKPNVRKHCFQNKRFFVLENILPSFGTIYWTTLDVNYWTISLPNSPENLPLKFLSQPFSFLFSFMSCTHTFHMECIMPFPNNSC